MIMCSWYVDVQAYTYPPYSEFVQRVTVDTHIASRRHIFRHFRWTLLAHSELSRILRTRSHDRSNLTHDIIEKLATHISMRRKYDSWKSYYSLLRVSLIVTNSLYCTSSLFITNKYSTSFLQFSLFSLDNTNYVCVLCVFELYNFRIFFKLIKIWNCDVFLTTFRSYVLYVLLHMQ